MQRCFAEYYRVLKPGRWMTVVFSNSKASVWNAIQVALQQAGFVVAEVTALDKVQGSYRQVTSTTAVKQDLVISAYKPNGGLEQRFAERGQRLTRHGISCRPICASSPVRKSKNGDAWNSSSSAIRAASTTGWSLGSSAMMCRCRFRPRSSSMGCATAFLSVTAWSFCRIRSRSMTEARAGRHRPHRWRCLFLMSAAPSIG